MYVNKGLTIDSSKAIVFVPEISTPRVPKRLPEPSKESTKSPTLQPKFSMELPSPIPGKSKPVRLNLPHNWKKPIEVKEKIAPPETSTTKSGSSPNSDTENADVVLMKLMVFALIGITFVVLMVLVVLLLVEFCPKCRKSIVEVREQTAHPMHCDARMTAVGLHTTCKMNSHFPPPLLPSNVITNERLSVSSISSSGTRSLALSEHRYSYIHLTDTMKKEMLQDPSVTAESKEKVQKELAEKEKLLRKSPIESAAENEERN